MQYHLLVAQSGFVESIVGLLRALAEGVVRERRRWYGDETLQRIH